MELYGLGKDRARFVHHLEAFAKLVAEKEREELLDIVYGHAANLSWNEDFQNAIEARRQA